MSGAVASCSGAWLPSQQKCSADGPRLPYAIEALKAKSVVPNADIVSELVAKGEVELGIIVVTQILTTPGVALVGPLPQELRITSSFVGAISSQAKAPEAARDLIPFLKTPAAVKVMRAQGMELLFEGAQRTVFCPWNVVRPG